jgi:hypothetical protein
VAVNDLSKLLLSGRAADVALAAQQLARLAENDDSLQVRAAAAAALAGRPQQHLDLAAFEESWREKRKQKLARFEFVNGAGQPLDRAARIGDSYCLQIQNDRTCYLTLLLRGSNGSWALGYPGWKSPGAQLSGGRLYRFPDDLSPFPGSYLELDRIEFGGPGTETAVALCSPTPLIQSDANDVRSESLPPLEEEEVMRLLGKALKAEDLAFSYCAVQVTAHLR